MSIESRATTQVAIAWLAIVVGLALILLAPTAPISDEPWYLNQVGYVEKHGVGLKLLKEHGGPAGPLFAVVQAAFKNVTHLRSPGVRLVNYGLFCLCFIFAILAAARGGAARPMVIASSVLAVFPLWKLGGIAFTEMPSIALMLMALLALFSDHARVSLRSGILFCLIAGLAAGVATVGRQTYLGATVTLILVLLVLGKRDLRVRALIFSIGALALPLLVFLLWGGLTPPTMSDVGIGELAPFHGLLGFAHCAIILAFACPWILAGRPGWIALAASPGVLAAVFSPSWIYLPMRGTIEVLVPEAVDSLGRISAIILCGIGSAAACVLANRALALRRCPISSACVLAIAALAASPITITHIFSSRYLGILTPLILLLALRCPEGQEARPLRFGIAVALGLAMLAAHLYSPTQGLPWRHPGDPIFYPELFEPRT